METVHLFDEIKPLLMGLYHMKYRDGNLSITVLTWDGEPMDILPKAQLQPMRATTSYTWQKRWYIRSEYVNNPHFVETISSLGT